MQSYYDRPYDVMNKLLLCQFGPAEQCVETILKYKEVGANYFIVRFASPDQMAQLHQFTQQVVPHLG